MNIRQQSNQQTCSHSQHGVAAIELAIMLVPLLLMLFGVIEYGRAIYQYNTLVKSTRDATRFLTTVSFGNPLYGSTGSVRTWDIAKCLAIYGNTTCSGRALVIGLDKQVQKNEASIIICDASTPTSSDCKDHSAVPMVLNGTTYGSANMVSVIIKNYHYQPLLSSFTLNLTSGGEVRIGLPSIKFGPVSNTMRQGL